MVLKHIGVLSMAKISAVMYAAIGLLLGLGMAAAFSLVPMARDNSGLPGFLAPMLGIGSVVVMPIMYGAAGLVIGAISAVIYNLFAGIVGGVELDLESSVKP